MRTGFQQTRFWTWLVAVGLILVFVAAGALPAVSLGSTAPNAERVDPTRPPVRRVVLEIHGATTGEAEALGKNLVADYQTGWEQRFERINDALELRVGGPNGPLITWSDRGLRGRYTWSYRDPVPEVRDISSWVGGGSQIKLWARIVQLPNGSGSRQCDMDTLFSGSRRQRWEFSGDVQYTITTERQRASPEGPPFGLFDGRQQERGRQ